MEQKITKYIVNIVDMLTDVELTGTRAHSSINSIEENFYASADNLLIAHKIMLIANYIYYYQTLLSFQTAILSLKEYVLDDTLLIITNLLNNIVQIAPYTSGPTDLFNASSLSAKFPGEIYNQVIIIDDSNRRVISETERLFASIGVKVVIILEQYYKLAKIIEKYKTKIAHNAKLRATITLFLNDMTTYAVIFADRMVTLNQRIDNVNLVLSFKNDSTVPVNSVNLESILASKKLPLLLSASFSARLSNMNKMNSNATQSMSIGATQTSTIATDFITNIANIQVQDFSADVNSLACGYNSAYSAIVDNKKRIEEICNGIINGDVRFGVWSFNLKLKAANLLIIYQKFTPLALSFSSVFSTIQTLSNSKSSAAEIAANQIISATDNTKNATDMLSATTASFVSNRTSEEFVSIYLTQQLSAMRILAEHINQTSVALETLKECGNRIYGNAIKFL